MRTPLLAATCLLLAECGSGGGEVVSVQTAAAPAATAVASPAPTVLTKAEAAQRYLQIVGPYNAALSKLTVISRKHRKDPSTAKVPAEYRQQAMAVGSAARAFMSALMSTPWPADVKPTAEKIVDEVSPEVTRYGVLAQAKTWADVEAEFAAGQLSNSGAQKIRVQLGLPPAK